MAVAENVLRSCAMLWFHFWFGCGLILLGLVVLISRIPVKLIQRHLLPWHRCLGQVWVYGVVVQIATSLYCRGDGFKPFIFGFLIILTLSMCIGHAAIRAYQRGLAEEAPKQMMSIVDPPRREDSENQEQVVNTGNRQAPASKRLAYLKYVHGVAMALAWAMLFGAGSVFTIRFVQLEKCMSLYAVDDSLANGAVIVEHNGILVMGGSNFTAPEL